MDAGADLNAYAKVDGQSGCCSRAPSPLPPTGLTVAPCCGSAPAATDGTVHEGLSKLLDRYDVNKYAASVKVYAVRPKA